MTVHRLAELTYAEVAELVAAAGDDLVAILPAGAIEAHGPHLPLATDRIIARAMAEAGAERLLLAGLRPLLLPPLDYTAAPFAAAFPGTLSVRPETVTAIVADVARALARHGVPVLAIANAHLDPAHLGALHAAAAEIGAAGAPRLVFPDLTEKPWALRLTEEFKSGACHAGRYEGSIVLARRPELVRDAVRQRLPPNPASLSRAIRRGARTFDQAGGPRAYFGDPAAASAAEGRTTIDVLGRILAEAVLDSHRPRA
ncbi:MAG: creatininase family protein [Acidobacteria bacterium]|nr:MAG: creatininase family protein [Acidobacteriota bacterium]